MLISFGGTRQCPNGTAFLCFSTTYSSGRGIALDVCEIPRLRFVPFEVSASHRSRALHSHVSQLLPNFAVRS
jgi:hypothetical protein